MESKDVMEALLEIAGDPETLQSIAQFAAEAEDTAEELESLEVPEKSAKTFSSQLLRLAEKVESKRVADALRRIAELVSEAPKAKWPELAGRIRRAVEGQDEEIRSRAERIAAKMEEESLAAYGYAYPAPEKAAQEVSQEVLLADLRDAMREIIAAEVAKAVQSVEQKERESDLLRRVEALETEVSGLKEAVEAVKARAPVPLPSLTQPATMPPAMALVRKISASVTPEP